MKVVLVLAAGLFLGALGLFFLIPSLLKRQWNVSHG